MAWKALWDVSRHLKDCSFAYTCGGVLPVSRVAMDSGDLGFACKSQWILNAHVSGACEVAKRLRVSLSLWLCLVLINT